MTLAIQRETFFTAPTWTPASTGESGFPQLRLYAVCVLVLSDGDVASGESAPEEPDVFDAEVARRNARRAAICKSRLCAGLA